MWRVDMHAKHVGRAAAITGDNCSVPVSYIGIACLDYRLKDRARVTLFPANIVDELSRACVHTCCIAVSGLGLACIV